MRAGWFYERWAEKTAGRADRKSTLKTRTILVCFIGKEEKMRQVKIFFSPEMGMIEKIRALGKVKDLGALKVEFDFEKYPDSALCVTEENVLETIKEFPEILEVK